MKKISILFTCLSIIIATSCTQHKTRIACVGDSITEGATHKWQSTSSYPAVLGKILGNNYTVINNGRSGTTAQVKGNFPYWKCKEITNTFAFAPDIILIKLGTNDTKPKNWNKERFRTDYQALIDTFQTMLPQPEIKLCLPVPAFKVNYGIRDSIITTDLIPIVKDLAKLNHLDVIDLHTPMQAYPQYFKDGIHPNEAGAEAMAKIIAEQLIN